jgi:hypothetical protein
MAEKILQINFKFNVSGEEYEQAVSPLADPIAGVSGLRWKVWIINEAANEAGGIYLFDDEISVQEYLAGPIVSQVKQHPALADISAKVFDVMEKPTAVTRGPIKRSVTA